MKKMICLLVSLVLLPTVCWAIRHPSCKLTNIAQVIKGKDSPEYQHFLSEQVKAIFGDKEYISFSELLGNSYFKREFAGLSVAEKEKLEAISRLGDSSYPTDWEMFPETAHGLVSIQELLVMLVVLDASIERDATGKGRLVLDTYPSLGKKGWLSVLDEKAMKKLIRDTASSPIAQTVRQRGKDNRVAKELQKLQIFNQNGSLNQNDVAEVMNLLCEGGDVVGLAKMVFGTQLKSAKKTDERDGGGVEIVLEDGTILTKRNMSYIVTIVHPDGSVEELSE